jgi:hypothetical protein
MRVSRAKSAQLKAARASRWEAHKVEKWRKGEFERLYGALSGKMGEEELLRAVMEAFLAIISGTGVGQVQEWEMWNSIPPAQKNHAYDLLHLVAAEVVSMGIESLVGARANIPENATLAQDGSWEHRINACRCMVTGICVETRQVICYQTVSSKEPGVPEYCEIPQNMEVHGLKLMIEDLKQCEESRRIVAYVHDNDARSGKLMKAMWPELVEFLDPGHALKSFRRKLGKHDKNWPAVVCQSLTSFMGGLLYSDREIEWKLANWQNAFNHFLGNHKSCVARSQCEPRGVMWPELTQNQNLKDEFQKFLDETEYILKKCRHDLSTQVCESFNRSKSKYANKDKRWGFTWPARMACAVLDRNWPGWKMELHHRLLGPLGHDLISETLAGLNQKERNRVDLNAKRVSPEAVNERRKWRKGKKEKKVSEAAEREKEKGKQKKLGYKPKPKPNQGRSVSPSRSPGFGPGFQECMGVSEIPPDSGPIVGKRVPSLQRYVPGPKEYEILVAQGRLYWAQPHDSPAKTEIMKTCLRHVSFFSPRWDVKRVSTCLDTNCD